MSKFQILTIVWISNEFFQVAGQAADRVLCLLRADPFADWATSVGELFMRIAKASGKLLQLWHRHGGFAVLIATDATCRDAGALGQILLAKAPFGAGLAQHGADRPVAQR